MFNFSSITQDYARVPVPRKDLRKWYSLAAVLIVTNINIPTLILGAQLGLQSSFSVLVIAVVVSFVLVNLVAALTTSAAYATKLSAAMLIRYTFGSVGGRIISLFIVMSMTGWFAVQTEVFATSIMKISDDFLDLPLARVPTIIMSVVLMTSTALIGYKAIEKLSFVSAPLLLILVITPFFMFDLDEGFSEIIGHVPEKQLTFSMLITILIGGFISWPVNVPDITRYARSMKDSQIAVFMNFTVASSLLILMTALLGVFTGETDFIKIMYGVGLGVPALLVLMFASWTTNDSNLYSSSLALAGVIDTFKKWQLVIVAAVIGGCLATYGILDKFIPWLVFLGIVTTPISGVLGADFLSNRSFYKAENLSILAKFRAHTLCAWLLAVLLAFATTPSENNGLGLFTWTTIPPVDAFFVSVILTLLGDWIYKRKYRLNE